MHTFLKYIEDNSITSILQIDKGRGAFKYLFEVIRESFENIWILVMTENKNLNRYENRNAYEVIFNNYETYKNKYPKFDLVLVSTAYSWDIVKIKELGKRVAFYAPFKSDTPPHLFHYCLDIHTFYNLHPKLKWLPEKLKMYLTKYKIFADKSFKLIVGEF